ncbi:MAG: glycosyltransferase [Thermocrispum sp.]
MPTVILATSNGTGMGHLTRQLSVATALGERVDPVLFSMSRAVPVIANHGLTGEYCPSRERDWMPHASWQYYLTDRICAFVEETGSRVLLFDGVVPYLGLLRARTCLPDVAFVWMRRGFWRPGVRTTPLRSAALFDLVLEPGDLASDGDTGATAARDDAVRLPPISLAEHVDPLPREKAAAELGLDPDRPTALVTLSSGVLNDVAAPGTAALNALLEDPGWQIAVTRTALTKGGVPISDPSRCVELSGVYPLVRYLAAFDAAIAAGGYNSVHELLYAAIPTLFVPNRSSGTDDQPARTRWLADNGFALFADETELDDVRAQARRLHDSALREELRAACGQLEPPTGSAAAAEALTGQSYAPGRRSSLRQAEVWARSTAMNALGSRGTALARRALGRSADAGPVRPLPVRLVDELNGAATPGDREAPLVVTDRLDADLLRGDDPLEHLLAGSSDRYRAARLAIARRYYDVVDGA